MTADEYIAHLRQFPPEAVVLTCGEWGDAFEAGPPCARHARATGAEDQWGARYFRDCRPTTKNAVPVVYVG